MDRNGQRVKTSFTGSPEQRLPLTAQDPEETRDPNP